MKAPSPLDSGAALIRHLCLLVLRWSGEDSIGDLRLRATGPLQTDAHGAWFGTGVSQR